MIGCVCGASCQNSFFFSFAPLIVQSNVLSIPCLNRNWNQTPPMTLAVFSTQSSAPPNPDSIMNRIGFTPQGSDVRDSGIFFLHTCIRSMPSVHEATTCGLYCYHGHSTIPCVDPLPPPSARTGCRCGRPNSRASRGDLPTCPVWGEMRVVHHKQL